VLLREFQAVARQVGICHARSNASAVDFTRAVAERYGHSSIGEWQTVAQPQLNVVMLHEIKSRGDLVGPAECTGALAIFCAASPPMAPRAPIIRPEQAGPTFPELHRQLL